MKIVALLIVCSGLTAVEKPRLDTLPPLDPEPMLVPANPELRERPEQEDQRPVDRQALVNDLNALMRIRERVRQRMVAGDVPG